MGILYTVFRESMIENNGQDFSAIDQLYYDNQL
jgi:hypothetical protein